MAEREETQHEDHASVYEQIVSALLSHDHIFFSPETSPHPPLIRQSSNSTRFSIGFRTIASLSLHPALEATLHLLNADLASAHFLLRHAQAPPAWECMYLHGILHRIEGDLDNARAWYGDVKSSDVLQAVWSPSDPKQRPGQQSSWESWLDRLERWRDHVLGRQHQDHDVTETTNVNWDKEQRELRRMSLQEMIQVLHFCEQRFGTAKVEDATQVWVNEGGTLQEKKQNMLVGGEGWREF